MMMILTIERHDVGGEHDNDADMARATGNLTHCRPDRPKGDLTPPLTVSLWQFTTLIMGTYKPDNS